MIRTSHLMTGIVVLAIYLASVRIIFTAAIPDNRVLYTLYFLNAWFLAASVVVGLLISIQFVTDKATALITKMLKSLVRRWTARRRAGD